MSSQTLYRLGGVTLIIGSLLLLIGSILGAVLLPGQIDSPGQVLNHSWVLLTLFTPIGSLLFVAGLPAMYLRQSGRAGVLGLTGFILLFFSSILLGVAYMFVQIVALPLLAQVAPQVLTGSDVSLGTSSFFLLLVSTLMDLLGSIVLGIATLRAHVFPRWAGILLIASGVFTLLMFPATTSPLSEIIGVTASATSAVAFFWCGYLLMGREYRTQETVPFATSEARTSGS